MLRLNSKVDGLSIFWLLMIGSVFIDSVSGFFVQQMGVDLRISQLTKMMLILFYFIYVLKNDRFYFFMLTSFVLLLFINPIMMVFSNKEMNAVMFDMPLALKVLLLVVASAFSFIFATKEPLRFEKNTKLTLYFGFIIVCLNVLLGYLGIGFYTYPTTEFGFKGFFQAGNELSALYVLLSSFILFDAWRSRKKMHYLFVALFILFIGVSIGTKSAIIFGFMAIFLVPIVISLPSWNLTKIICYCMLVTFVIILVLILVYILLSSAISESVLYGRLNFIFHKYGVVGLILSGRDLFLIEFFSGIKDSQGYMPLIFGFGSGEGGVQNKMLEMDFFDVLMYWGMPIALLCLSIAVCSIIFPLFLIKKRPYAPLVLIVNLVLFFQSVVAGHVWTSGMLATTWALVNGLLVINFNLQRDASNYDSVLLHKDKRLNVL